ncbi:polyserase-related [Holotrichia oblita]|uniref:Polyserase-related n=1 Tax=Holotrichia oblita TaxID=644536 RepID=A0ACB9SYJ9_HOLOL|nr:polyserase-related [Holotrichia oblita]
MIAFILGAVLLATANAGIPRAAVPRLDGRIIGGSSVDISAYPYQISLLWWGSHICGGSIISQRYVVTAAHCTDGSSASSLSIRAGSSTRNSGGTVVSVSVLNQHPSFDYWSLDYDISVLTLASSLSFGSNIAAISLPAQNQQLAAGTESVVSGWGTTSENGAAANQLQAVSVPLVSLSDCQAAYSPVYSVTDRMLCAGSSDGGRDACQGDSGGPLAVDGLLVGVVSWGIGCARPQYPGVYASVPNLRSYITQVSGV